MYSFAADEYIDILLHCYVFQSQVTSYILAWIYCLQVQLYLSSICNILYTDTMLYTVYRCNTIQWNNSRYRQGAYESSVFGITY
jgi:hypothetical protein